MMPTKDLRSAAGKAAWLGSILPRARWCVAVLYCVLKSVENDELQGKETSRAQHREGDQRPKKRPLCREETGDGKTLDGGLPSGSVGETFKEDSCRSEKNLGGESDV